MIQTKQEVQKKNTDQLKQVIFTLGEEEYGLDIMLVNAIEKYSDMVRVPNAPTFIQGIINIRGEVIPVYSLRKKFGLPERETDENSKLIITKSNDIMMAFAVDSVNEILEIPAEKLNDTPMIVKSNSTAYIKCVANINGRMILLLDHNGILSSNEQESIESLMSNQ
jgi:purine-binding chemotaxis protein CheW